MKKRIIFVIGSLAGGGAEKLLIDIISKIDKEKYDVSLCLFKKDGVLLDFIPKGIEIYYLSSDKKPKFISIVRWLIKEVYPQLKPDIIISFLEYANIAVIISRLFSRMKPKVVLTEHIYPVNLKFYMNKFIKKFIERIACAIFYRHADKIIAVSKGLKQGLVKKLFLPSELIEVIYNGIDIKKIEALSAEPLSEKEEEVFGDMQVIVFCGRLVPQKNVKILIEAINLVCQKRKVRLLILGKGPQAKYIKGLIKQYNLEEYIYMMGYKKNPYKYMNRAGILISPSLFEGFSLVICDAMASGAVAISTDCPAGPSEIINHEINGILVKNNNSSFLKNEILRILDNKTLRENIKKAGRKRVFDFDINKTVKQYEKLLEVL
jgi:glycosyltransferase involved in cell wall biosynthesis